LIFSDNKWSKEWGIQAAKTTGRVAAGFVPLVGTGWDAYDAYQSARAGDWWGFAANS